MILLVNNFTSIIQLVVLRSFFFSKQLKPVSSIPPLLPNDFFLEDYPHSVEISS